LGLGWALQRSFCGAAIPSLLLDTNLGNQNRADPGQTHGGILVAAFQKEAFRGLLRGDEEILVGAARELKESPEEMFERLNP